MRKNKMKNILLIIIGLMISCAGGFVIFMNWYLNPPMYTIRIQDGINPVWLVLMFGSIASLALGLMLIAKGIDNFK
jgi:hypothetical protein